MNIFITGTDTDIGKTVITAGLAAVMQSLGYTIGVYKPVQSGAVDHNGFLMSPDIKFTKSIDPNVKTKCSYNLKYPVAPALAAAVEKVRISKEAIVEDYNSMQDRCDMVLVEGAGGIMVPVYQNFLMCDLAKLLKTPIVIVARPNLGTINHTLLTINVAKQYGLEIRGVIINNFPHNSSDLAIKTAPKLIEDLSGVPVLGKLPVLKNSNGLINPETLLGAMINHVDIQKLFDIKIPKLSE